MITSGQKFITPQQKSIRDFKNEMQCEIADILFVVILFFMQECKRF